MFFVRKHDTLIDAPPEAVFDYVCNPHSWPEWLAASHKIEGPDRALELGQTFREEWQIRRGMIALHWKVTESDRPRVWTCEADTDFIGPIVIRYTFASEGAGTRYTRQLCNPSAPRNRRTINSSAWTRRRGSGLPTSSGKSSSVPPWI